MPQINSTILTRRKIKRAFPLVVLIIFGILTACRLLWPGLLTAVMAQLAIVFFMIGTIILVFPPRIKAGQFKQFAKNNSLTITEETSLEKAPPLIGYEGENHNIPFEMKGAYKSGELSIFPYCFIKLNAVNTQIKKNYWVARVEGKHKLPEFVIDAVYNDVPIKEYFKDYEKLRLEGNFSEYFRIYSPSKRHIAVMSVLSPDVMDALMEFATITDVIVAGKVVWIIAADQKNRETVMTDLFDAIEILMPEFMHRARTYKETDTV